uniref:Methyltransferase domain-containing protein n=1 Tax=Thermorudis peleae TaxID=1382356 RepID=A0A831WYP3_9BACT
MEIKQRVREQFGATAESYVRSRSHAFGHDLGRLLEWASVRPGELALDVATGGGHTGLALARHGARVILLDLTPEMLQAARRNAIASGIAPAGFIAADAEALPLADRCVSLLTCRIAPHHFADPAAFVREVARVLEPGGRFLLIDSLSPADHELDELVNELERRRDTSHVRSYTLAEWCGFLAAAGLRVERVEVIDRRHEWEDWTVRSGMSEAARDALARWLLGQERLCRFLDVEFDRGSIRSFRDDKVLILASSPKLRPQAVPRPEG